MPAWSMGKSKREDDQPKDKVMVPGPGQYPPSDPSKRAKASPSWKMGTSKREEISKVSLVPGPGAYTAEKKNFAPAYGIRGKNNIEKIPNVPGPGNYNPSTKLVEDPVSRGYSFSGRAGSVDQSEKLKKAVPGPGNYTLGTTMESRGGAVFGSEKRPGMEIASMTRNPGPGAYPLQDVGKIVAQTYHFGKSTREERKNASVAPGPGAYPIHTVIGKEGHRFTMPGRYNSREGNTFSPGPAAYTTISGSSTHRDSYSFGKVERNIAHNRSIVVPGPGAYDNPLPRKYSPSWKIGTAKRPEISRATNVPGPGNYTYRTAIGEGPKVGMSARLSSEFSKTPSPGPGSYEPKINSVVDSSPTTGLGYGPRSELGHSTKLNVPGPGAYTTADIKKASPAYGFGHGSREIKKADFVPGPGNYDKVIVSTLPAYELSKMKPKQLLITLSK